MTKIGKHLADDDEQTDPIEALDEAVAELDDGDPRGVDVGAVVEKMLDDPTITIGDVGSALKEGYFHGVIYQPSQSTVARVATDGGEEGDDCSNPECDGTLGYDAGWDDPPKGEGHITATFNPEDEPSFVVSEERTYCSVGCLIEDADNHPFKVTADGE